MAYYFDGECKDEAVQLSELGTRAAASAGSYWCTSMTVLDLGCLALLPSQRG